MKKSDAIRLVMNSGKFDLNHRNTIFSNPGSWGDVWWLEPANSKFKTGFYIILNDPNSSKLYLFKIQQGELKKELFRQRTDKEASLILIPRSSTKFQDVKGYDFTAKLISEIKY